MSANTPSDFELKVSILDDIFSILDFEKIIYYSSEVYTNDPINIYVPVGSGHNRRNYQ